MSKNRTVKVEIGDRVHIPWDWDGSPCAEYVVLERALVLIGGDSFGASNTVERSTLEEEIWSSLHLADACTGSYNEDNLDTLNMRLRWTD